MSRKGGFRFGDLTLGSSKNIGQLSQKGDKGEGEDCATNILGISVGGPMLFAVRSRYERCVASHLRLERAPSGPSPLLDAARTGPEIQHVSSPPATSSRLTGGRLQLDLTPRLRYTSMLSGVNRSDCEENRQKEKRFRS